MQNGISSYLAPLVPSPCSSVPDTLKIVPSRRVMYCFISLRDTSRRAPAPSRGCFWWLVSRVLMAMSCLLPDMFAEERGHFHAEWPTSGLPILEVPSTLLCPTLLPCRHSVPTLGTGGAACALLCHSKGDLRSSCLSSWDVKRTKIPRFSPGASASLRRLQHSLLCWKGTMAPRGIWQCL